MANPTDSLVVSLRCSGNSPAGLIGKTKYGITALTPANFAAQVAAGNALAGAEDNLSNAVLANTSIEVNLAGSAAYPTAIANRGQKWIVTAANTNGRKFTYTIPAALPTGNVEADNFTALLTSTAWAAYVTAFNGLAVDPAGNALTVSGAKLGGRRR